MVSVLIKILHFKETDSDEILVREELKKANFAFEYVSVKTSQEFEKQLVDFDPEAIICHYSLLEKNKRLVFSNEPGLFIPYILIANTFSKELADEMTQSGAADYVFKDRTQRLPLAILSAVNKSAVEKELHAKMFGNEKKFQALIENISDAIILLDAKANITYQSPSAKRISGFAATETIGESIFKFIHPDDLKIGKKYFEKVRLKPGQVFLNSYRILQKKGTYIWVESTTINLLNDANIDAIIINYRDIAERKLSEELLQKSEANLRTIFDNTNISYVLADKNFHILSFNSRALLTYKHEFKVNLTEGDNLLDYIPEERKLQSRQRFEKALSGEKVSYEMSFVQAAGNLNWYQVNMFAVRDGLNNLLGFIISSENSTDRKNIELERTKILSDILQHNKDLEQFAYIISHNLRSPVANILGLSALIDNTPNMDDATFNKCMQGLSLSVKKLDDVIVDLNHILQTRREINENKELVSFSSIINDIKTSINSIIEKENINIVTDFKVKKCFTLKSYLYSIFFNLIYNSIKYRNPNTATVIKIQSRLVNNKLVLLFEDNGLGIDLIAHGENIFGLYKKFHTHIEGKGMGLYMVKTQVEILGGKISLSSEVNKGSIFMIEFAENALI